MANRIFGCPKCGCPNRFLEHKLARIAYDFDDFGTEGMVLTFGNSGNVDFNTAEPLAHGAYQCRNCGTYFNHPAELTSEQVNADHNPNGPPIRPDLIVSEAEVTWFRAGNYVRPKPPRFGCPKGHTDGITASYTIDIEVPADLVQERGDETTDTDLDDCETGNWNFNHYWCPTCTQMFDHLVELKPEADG